LADFLIVSPTEEREGGTRCLGGDVATSRPVLRLAEKERFEELLQQRTNLSLATCPELEHPV